MLNNKIILATICARGRSKGIKNKNIKLLNNKPVIIYSLELLSKSKYIDEYIISTDSEKIIETIKEYGYKIEYKRPDYLAGDKVSRIDAIKHVVEWIEKRNNIIYDVIIDIGVATPLKNAEDLDNCLELLVNSDADNVFSVTPASRNPYFNMVEEIDGKIQKVKKLPGNITDRRDAPKVYDMNDGFNVWKHDVLFSSSPQFNDKTRICIMPAERSIDLDEEIDFRMAELLAGK